VFALIGKSIADEHLGKIQWRPNGWIYSDAGWTNRSGHFIPPHEDVSTGRLVSLKDGRHVINCPTPPVPDAYKGKHGHYVPYGKCLKCPMRIRGGYCKELRTQRLGKDPIAEFTNIVDKAVTTAKEMLGQ
jgi:hypothetical protein